MSKISTAAKDLYDRIAGREAAQAAAAAEIADLRKQAAWARRGAPRRVTAIAARATQLADSAAADAAAITAAVVDLEAAARRVHQLGAAYNGALSAVHADLVAEDVPAHSGGSVPPSPVHAGVAPASNGGIRIGDINIHTVGTDDLVAQALAAAKTTDPVKVVLTLTTVAPPLEGRYWRSGATVRCTARQRTGRGRQFADLHRADAARVTSRLSGGLTCATSPSTFSRTHRPRACPAGEKLLPGVPRDRRAPAPTQPPRGAAAR